MTAVRPPIIQRLITSRGLVGLIAVVALAAIGWHGAFVVDETEIAIVRAWGQACKPPIAEAGFYVKWPWQTVHRDDRRVRSISFDAREKLTGDHERIVVRPRVFWRIPAGAAERFVRCVGDAATASALLGDLVWRVLDRELAERPLTDWQNSIGDREPAGLPPQLAIMARVTAVCRSEAMARFGIELLDVQLQQFDRPEGLVDDLLRLMEADRSRQIGRRCLDVDLERNRLAADALREADRILSDAEQKASRTRADGRREAMRLEAEARTLNTALTDYLIQLDNYRVMAEKGGAAESPVGLSGAIPTIQPAMPKIKPAPTGQAPTPDTAPAPRSGNKANSRPE